jgi:hypothetical protein
LVWFRDGRNHLLESRSKCHRMIFCNLCGRLILKSECVKLRMSAKTGSLYQVKKYSNARPSMNKSIRLIVSSTSA